MGQHRVGVAAEGVTREDAADGVDPGAIDELGLQPGHSGAGVVERPAQIVAVPPQEHGLPSAGWRFVHSAWTDGGFRPRPR